MELEPIMLMGRAFVSSNKAHCFEGGAVQENLVQANFKKIWTEFCGLRKKLLASFDSDGINVNRARTGAFRLEL